MKVILKHPGQDPEIIDISEGWYEIREELGYEPEEILSTPEIAVLAGKDAKHLREAENVCDGLEHLKIHGTVLVAGNNEIDYRDVPDIDGVLWKIFRAVQYSRDDRRHNVWSCRHCGYIQQFEADGPYENGWNVCPDCGGKILRPKADRH